MMSSSFVRFASTNLSTRTFLCITTTILSIRVRSESLGWILLIHQVRAAIIGANALGKVESIGCGQHGQQLPLLRLVVQHRDLSPIRGAELLPLS